LCIPLAHLEASGEEEEKSGEGIGVHSKSTRENVNVVAGRTHPTDPDEITTSAAFDLAEEPLDEPPQHRFVARLDLQARRMRAW